MYRVIVDKETGVNYLYMSFVEAVFLIYNVIINYK